MSFRDLGLKVQYISGVDNLVKDFYLPVLGRSKLYQRRTGYFNSRALAMAARGLSGLINNGGKMQMICSVELDAADMEVYSDPSKHARFIDGQARLVAKMMEEPYDQLEKDRFSILAEMLSRGLLEIKVAFPDGSGIFHEKAGIFKDEAGNFVAFNGSDNETPGGWLHNTESFHVFRSWGENDHILSEQNIFDMLWNERFPKVTVVPLPKAIEESILRYKRYDDGDWWTMVDRPERDGQQVDVPDFVWTPELAYIFESPRLWNRSDFAFAETGIEPFEHQDYVANTVMSLWPPRCMLCDEVGLGKTIEAGLILKGLMASGKLDRVLILAPKNILKQWQLQMLSKFNLTTWILEGNYVLGPQPDPDLPVPKEPADIINPFRTKPIMLVSSQLVRSEARLAQATQVEYDLIFLDEAHHARASRGAGGRRESNLLLQAMESLKLQTQGLIFMTATPIQLSRTDLWDLLMVLEIPGEWQDENSFDRFFEEMNKKHPDWNFLLDMVRSSINAYGIDKGSVRSIGTKYPKVDVYRLEQLLKDGNGNQVRELSAQEVEALKLLLYRHTPAYKLIFRNTRELLKEYHRQGKFKERIADREPLPPIVISLDGSEDDPRSELGLYSRIDKYVRDYYDSYNSVRKGLGFIMEVYRKRLTSSFYAITKSLERRRDKLQTALRTGDLHELIPDEIEEEDEAEYEGAEELGDLRSDQVRAIITAELEYLNTFLNDLRSLRTDTKTDAMDELLRKLLRSGTRQVIMFSQYMDTVEHILDYLRPKYGDKLGSYSGSGGRYWDGGRWATCSKQKIQEKFRNDDDPLCILVCTDAASEGLDLQTCDTLINFDIPWNPMRIEQRIGRIDRIGQRSPKVFIHTYFYKDTVEEEVYRRCLQRIDFFRTTLGNLQPILAQAHRMIRQGAMAKNREDGAKVIDEMDRELQRSIAELDEEIRIDDFLNHYEPSYPVMKGVVPISQQELRLNFAPVLEGLGWKKEEDVWSKDGSRLTFDPSVMDSKDSTTELLTPLSNLTHHIGVLPAMVDEIPIDGAGRLIKASIDGQTMFMVKDASGFRSIKTLADIRSAEGRYQSTMDACMQEVQYILRQRKRENLDAALGIWNNRLEGWKVRVGMYLNSVFEWRMNEIGTGIESFDEDRLRKAWNDYLREAERAQTKQLASMIDYAPPMGKIRTKRGRKSSSSPRSSEKEGRMLREYLNIVDKIERTNISLKEIEGR